MLEAHVFGGIIINIRSTAMPFVDAMNTILGGSVKDIKAAGTVVKPGNIQPFVVKKLLPLAAPYVFSSQKLKLPVMMQTLKLMGYATRSDISEIRAITDDIVREISKVNTKFAINRITTQNRIKRLKETYGIEMLGLANDIMPEGEKEAFVWILDYINLDESNALLDNVAYFIFFGEFLEQLITAKSKKDDRFGAKQGFIKLSKTTYQKFSDKNNAAIFYQNKQKASFGINWISDKKSDILFAKSDLENLGLAEGDTVTLILSK